MMLRVIGMFVLASLSSSVLAHASGSEVFVSPENISSQPFEFRITTDAVDGGAVSFLVTVKSGSTSVAEDHDGQLRIPPPESVRQRADRVRVLQRPILWCNLQDCGEGGTVKYSFILPEELLSRVEFQFLNTPGIGSVDAYTFRLGEFWPR